MALRLALLGLAASLAAAHVRLTFPPARWPRLDFLDNVRTQAHCGVAKPGEGDPKAIRTTLQAGSTFNVSWFMSYAHQGGLRIELLNSRDQPFAVLTPAATTYVGQDNEQLTSYTVTLPNEECRNCGLRLIRQASEWGQYRFWTCADVDILHDAGPRAACSGRAELVDGDCACQGPYSGQYCHIQDECALDGDCGTGICQDQGPKAAPRRVCFCRPGFFGTQCDKVSSVSSRRVDESQYESRSVGRDEDKIMWRVLQESSEVEFVVRYKSASWVALGWRPVNVDPQCALLPQLARPELPPAPEPEPEGEGVAEPEPEPEAAVPESEPLPEVVPEYAAEYEYPEYAVPELPTTFPGLPDGRNVPATISTGNDSASVGVTFDAGIVTASFELSEEGNGTAFTTHSPTTLAPEPEEDTHAEVIGDLCYGDWRFPEGCRDCEYRISWSYQEEGDEIEFSVETRAPTKWWTGVGISKTGNMSDADMLIVKSKSGVLTLHDMYSTDFEVPSEDLQQDLHTSTVVGTHQNGVIRATFSRRRDTMDRDHDLAFTDADDGCYFLLFPVSGGRLGPDGDIRASIEAPVRSSKKICIRPCYTSSEEGAAPTPSVTLPGGEGEEAEFVDGTCETEYRFPTGCVGDACIYHASWAYDMASGNVGFTIASKEVGRWTGIGFSRDGNMTNSDIYTGWVSLQGKAFVTDRFAFGRQLPAIDKGRQDIFDVEGRIEGDIQTLSFKRKAITDDSLTDFPLTECYYFLFPIGGGRVLARSEEDFEDPETAIGFHDRYPPRSSKEKICICAPLEDARRRRRQVAVGEPHSHAEPQPEPHANPEPEPEPEAGAPKLHAMDCMDVVVASAVGSAFRVSDEYTVSRATPMADEEYGGTQSLSGALAWEEDGFTNLIFRRKIHTGDPFGDHSLINGPMLAMWAKGQGGLYPTDVPMYHGPTNRGSFPVNFHASSSAKSTFCHGGYQFPAGCQGSLCQYNITYYRDEGGLHFELDTQMSPNRWTGVGFSREGLMQGSDVIMASVMGDGSVQVTDRYADGYGEPQMDESQDIYNVHARYAAGRLSAKFTRDVVTEDGRDANLAECHYFVYPASGGPVAGASAMKHSAVPTLSAKQICLSACRAKAPLPHPESEPKPEGETPASEPGRRPVPDRGLKKPTQPNIDAAAAPGFGGSSSAPTKFLMSLRIMNEAWREPLKSAGTPQHRQLTQRLISSLDSLFKKKLPGFSTAKLIRFKGERDGAGTTAEVEVQASGHAAADLIDAVQPAVAQGQLEGLEIDAQRITAQKVSTGTSPEEIRNWVIIGVACFLVTAAIIFAVCMIVRTKKSKSRDLKGKPSVPFSPYSYLMTSGYAGAYPGGPVYGGAPYPAMAMAAAPGLPDKGYENGAYGDVYGRAHNRQYSSATTASQAAGAATSESPQGSDKPTTETSYGEWYNRVSSSDAAAAPSDGAQGTQGRAARPRPKPGAGAYPGPYVSYPNDPYNYYTINGRNQAPPNYYRPY